MAPSERRRRQRIIHPARSRLHGSTPFCALNPLSTTKQAGEQAGGASRRAKGTAPLRPQTPERNSDENLDLATA
eukprot:15124910-Alexandrium_andersonii.AAC.1